MIAADDPPFIRSIIVVRDRIEDAAVYPFSLPAVQALDGLALSAVTYFIGVATEIERLGANDAGAYGDVPLTAAWRASRDAGEERYFNDDETGPPRRDRVR